MKLFISWSGQLSHKIAEVLAEWFPLVINKIEPFLSSENIKKGNRWPIGLYSELEKSNFGIICLTKENLSEPWIMFEAGALAKNIDESRVSAILFDGLQNENIDGPLSLFQNTQFEKEEFKKLVISINEFLGENQLSESMLNRTFDKWFPELEEKILKIQKTYVQDFPHHENDNEINEILKLTRFISETVSRFNLKISSDELDFSKYSNNQEIMYLKKDYNHPVKIFVNPVNGDDGTLKEILIDNNGIHISPSKGAEGRGVIVKILFFTEVDETFWNLILHFHKGNTYISSETVYLSYEETERLRYAPIWRD